MNYELCKEYFKKVNENVDESVNYGSAASFIIFGLLCFAAIGCSPIFAVVGIVLIVIGILCITGRKKEIQKEKERIQKELDSIPSDAQYDTEVAKKLTDLKSSALAKLGLDEDEVNEIAPITFDWYDYEGAENAKQGKDGLWRTDRYKSVMIFFSPNEVHCYTYRFETLKDKHTESTDVYFYKDIVSVSTTSESTKLFDNSIDYESFKLTTTGGTSISVSLRDANNVQRSINAMRALIKEKKMA